jgi:hypothetical protein
MSEQINKELVSATARSPRLDDAIALRQAPPVQSRALFKLSTALSDDIFI